MAVSPKTSPLLHRAVPLASLALALVVGCAGSPTAKQPARVASTGLVGTTGAGVVSNNAGALSGTVLGPAAGIVGQNAASLLANNGGGVLSNNGGALRLLATDPALAPVAGAHVDVVDVQGQVLASSPVTTDATGKYTLAAISPSGPLVFVRARYQADGHDVALEGAIPAPHSAGNVQANLDPASTLIARKVGVLVRAGKLDPASLDAKMLAGTAAAVAAELAPKDLVAAVLLPEGPAAAALDAVISAHPGLVASVRAVAGAAAQTLLAPTPTNVAPPSAPPASPSAAPPGSPAAASASPTASTSPAPAPSASDASAQPASASPVASQAPASSTPASTAPASPLPLASPSVVSASPSPTFTAFGAFSVMPQHLEAARGYHSTLLVGRRVYLVGGNAPDKTSVEYADIAEDGSLGAWTMDTHHLNHGRLDAACATTASMAYFVGGEVGVNNTSQSVVEAAPLAGGALGAFSDQPPLQSPRRWPGVIVAKNKLHVIGGNGLDSCESAPINPDGTLGNFTQDANHLQTPREYHAVVTYGNYVYVLGGEDGTGTYLTSVERAQIAQDGTLGPWQAAGNLVRPRGEFVTAVLGNKLYVIGGWVQAMVPQIEVATVDSSGNLGAFADLPGQSLVTPRDDTGLVTLGNFLYVLGGDGQDDVERAPLQ